MENPIEYVTEKVCAYFMGTPNLVINSTGKQSNNVKSLVRFHTVKLNTLGDLSVPCSSVIWKNYFAHCGVEPKLNTFEIFDAIDEKKFTEAETNLCVYSAKNWDFPVERMQIKNERCALFLLRSTVMSQILHRVLKPMKGQLPYGYQSKNEQMRLCLLQAPALNSGANELSIYRATLVEGTLKKLLAYSEWIVLDNEAAVDANVVKVQVVSVGAKAKKKNDSTEAINPVVIKCGIVTDPQSGKIADTSTKDYHKMRTLEMRLMAMHKYGLRAKDDRVLLSSLERLGVAAVTVDLLEVKPSNPVHLIRNGQGSTKGAAFILYNSARLETLLREFDDRVKKRVYAQLPDLEDVDLTVLNEDEEWQLVWAYIFTFPELIDRCLEQLKQGICSTHLIIRFLTYFVALFSAYYRRIRILTDKRDHLMTYLYARIYLLKALRDIFNRTLALLDIEPVSFM